MESKELLVTGLQQSYALALPLFEDLRSAPLVPTTSGGNHAHWILGHLTLSEGGLHALLHGGPNPVERLRPLFHSKTEAHPTGAGYPAYEELLAELVRLRGETMERFQSTTEEELDRVNEKSPPGMEAFFGTWRRTVLMQALHWMNHRGQLADCRRSAGRQPLML